MIIYYQIFFQNGSSFLTAILKIKLMWNGENIESISQFPVGGVETQMTGV